MAFPTTPPRDDFNRADSNPISGNWLTSTAWYASPGNQLLSNAMAHGDPAGSPFSSSFYTSVFGPDFEYFWTLGGTIPGTPGTNDFLEVSLLTLDPATQAVQDGFHLYFFYNGAAWGIEIYRIDTNVETLLADEPVTFVAGDQFGVRRYGSQIQFFQNSSPILTVDDPNHYRALYCTPSFGDTNGATKGYLRLDNFGGGTLARTTVSPTILGSISSGRGGAGGTSFPHTVVSGTDALLIYVFYRDFGNSLPDVTYGGTLVPVLNHHLFNPFPPSSFRIINPPIGTASVVVTPPSGAILPDSCAAFAVNVANYGGIRFADWAQSNISILDPPLYSPVGAIFNEPTDLLLTFVGTDKSGATFTPDASQTLLFAQDGLGDALIKMAAATAPRGLLTSTDWALTPDERVFVNYITAIKGLDGFPFDAPVALGPVSNSFTTEDQPTTGNVGGSQGENWRWWHTVPFTHRFLTILICYHDGFLPPTGITFGGVPLTKIFDGGVSQQWVLAVAPIGTFEIVVAQAGQRTFCAGAYSLSTSGVIATVSGQTLTHELVVPSQPDAIAISLINFYRIAIDDGVRYAPDPGQTLLFEQPFLLNSLNPRPNLNTSGDAGASSYGIATGASITMGWTPDPSGNFDNLIAFSFIPEPPPPPPPEQGEGCPNTLGVIAAEAGTGCSVTLPTG